jgi:hypothetical protein
MKNIGVRFLLLPYVGDTIGNPDIFQAVASCKSRFSYAGNYVWNVNFLKYGHLASEGKHACILKTLGQIDFHQFDAAAERIGADTLYPFGEFHRAQIPVFPKRSIPDLFYASRNCNTFQRNRKRGVRQIDGFQLFTAGKSIFTNTFQVFRENQLSQ